MGIKDFFKKAEPIGPGFHAGTLEIEGRTHRIHLRIEGGGNGLLTLDASRILHLNATAAEMVLHLIRGRTESETVGIMAKRYRVARPVLEEDIARVFATVTTLSETDQVCPMTDLGVDLIEPYSPDLSAPLRMDLAVTYRCQNKCAHCYNEPERKVEELDTESWKRCLDRCYEAGIPHVVFTGGEPTLREDLPDLVAYAEELGLVTGLNSNGRKLADAAAVERLKEVGLDHVQITLESAEAAIHDEMTGAESFDETLAGLRNAIAAGLYTLTNTTLTRKNGSGVEKLVDLAADEGLPAVAMNGMIYSGKGKACGEDLSPEAVIPLMEAAARRAREREIRLIWYTPTRYCEMNPVELGLGVKQCTAARLSMAVEPDGTVIPCQSYYEGVGNLLKDDWKDIWNHSLCLRLRKPQKPLDACAACEHLSLCGGGCPLAAESDRTCCREVSSGG